MNRASYLLLSDIHFGQHADSPDFVVKPNKLKHHLNSAVSMKDSLIEKLKGQSFDGMLVLGDLTSFGSPAEFCGCEKVLREISESLTIPEEQVFFSFGNHDLDWDISRLADKEGDTLYYKVAGSVGNIFVNNHHHSNDAGPLPGTNVFETENSILFVMNSGFFSVHDQVHCHGRLGSKQLEWFQTAIKTHSNREKWRIVMLHHHPFNYPYPTFVQDLSCLEEGAELVAAIGGGGIDIVCHGHRHHPRLHTEMQSGWDSPTTFLCAGSLSVHPGERSKGEIPNCFHVLHLNSRLDDGAAFGEIHSFQYSSPKGWIPVKNSESLPLDSIQMFGALCGESEKTAEAKNAISSVIAFGQDTPLLPNIDDLPVKLQCLPLQELNSLLISTAKELSVRIVGKYPQEVAVLRLGS